MLKLVKYAAHQSFHVEKERGENVTHEKLWQWNLTASNTDTKTDGLENDHEKVIRSRAPRGDRPHRDLLLRSSLEDGRTKKSNEEVCVVTLLRPAGPSRHRPSHFLTLVNPRVTFPSLSRFTSSYLLGRTLTFHSPSVLKFQRGGGTPQPVAAPRVRSASRGAAGAALPS